jgi:hypothetical protein
LLGIRLGRIAKTVMIGLVNDQVGNGQGAMPASTFKRFSPSHNLINKTRMLGLVPSRI